MTGEPIINADNGNIVDFNAAKSTTNSFKIKGKVTGETGNDGTKSIEIILPLKYLRNFWGALEMLLISCEINLNLTCSEICFIVATAAANQEVTFSISDAKLYVPVVSDSNGIRTHNNLVGKRTLSNLANLAK